jgi:hypothetical protein
MARTDEDCLDCYPPIGPKSYTIRVCSTCGRIWESADRRRISTDAQDDEKRLWAAVEAGEWPSDAGHRLGIPPKRVQYLCLKWARKRIYDYGVSCDLGWPT